MSDTGEKGTQRIVAKMLMERCYGNRQLSVLDRGDTLDGDGIPRSHKLAMQLDVADRKKKREDVSTELMQDKEKSTAVPRGYYKLKGDAELEYHFGCDSDRERKEAVIRTSVYDNVSEKFLIGMHPLGKAVITATYVDGKLLNPGYLTGSQVRVLHMENQTPVNWYWERHATVKKTATYGSELEAMELLRSRS